MLGNDSSSNMYLVSEEKIKESLGALKSFFLSGDSKEVLTLVGEVSKVSRGVKLVVDVRNWHIARKIKKFVEGLEEEPAKQKQFQELLDKYGKDKVLGNVLLSLDSMRSEKQASAFAPLFLALLRGDLSWDRFSELQNILEKIDPSALDEDFNNSQPTYKLVTVGLAYIQTVLDGVKITPNGHLYNDFKKYIVVPYRNSND